MPPLIDTKLSKVPVNGFVRLFSRLSAERLDMAPPILNRLLTTSFFTRLVMSSIRKDRSNSARISSSVNSASCSSWVSSSCSTSTTSILSPAALAFIRFSVFYPQQIRFRQLYSKTQLEYNDVSYRFGHRPLSANLNVLYYCTSQHAFDRKL